MTYYKSWKLSADIKDRVGGKVELDFQNHSGQGRNLQSPPARDEHFVIIETALWVVYKMQVLVTWSKELPF